MTITEAREKILAKVARMDRAEIDGLVTKIIADLWSDFDPDVIHQVLYDFGLDPYSLGLKSDEEEDDEAVWEARCKAYAKEMEGFSYPDGWAYRSHEETPCGRVHGDDEEVYGYATLVRGSEVGRVEIMVGFYPGSADVCDVVMVDQIDLVEAKHG